MLASSSSLHCRGPAGCGHCSAPPRRQEPRRGALDAEPLIETEITEDAYALMVTPPKGFMLKEPEATVEGRNLILHGHIVLKQPRNISTHKYITTSLTVVYDCAARPVAVLARGSVLHGGRPSADGWIRTAAGNHVLDDGTLDLLSVSRPPDPVAYRKTLELPDDVGTDGASCQCSDDGSMFISVPRIRSVQPAPMPMKRPFSAGPPRQRKPSSATAPKPKPPRPAIVTQHKPSPAAAAAPKPQPQPVVQPASQQTPRRTPEAAQAAIKSRSASSPSPSVCCTKPPQVIESAGLPNTESLLHQTALRAEKVQRPVETAEEWVATECGGFVRVCCWL